MITTRVESVQRDISILVDDALGPQARSAALARFAEIEIEKTERHNQEVLLGLLPIMRVFVDGREGAALISVKPEGRIIAEWDITLNLLDDIERMLIQASPKLTGRYSKSHILLADGRQVASVTDVPSATEYIFVNTTPYARKVEGIGRAPQSRQAPEGVYKVVAKQAKALARQRGNTDLKISYGIVSIAGLGRRRVGRSAASDRVPAIIIRMR